MPHSVQSAQKAVRVPGTPKTEAGLLLEKLRPFEEWYGERPRSNEDTEFYRYVADGLKEVDERCRAGVKCRRIQNQ